MEKPPMYEIDILVYDEKKNQFKPGLHVTQDCKKRSKSILSVHVARQEGIWPSEEWLADYEKFNAFYRDDFKGHPIFASCEALREFNKTGASLVSRLRQELSSNHHKHQVRVADFQPLYSNIKVGNAVSAWWHIMDQNYKFVIPIQHLPVSEQLKSRLMAWRFRKSRGWLSASCCQSLNQEGHDLEEHILWELNVCESKDVTDCRQGCERLMKQESFESVHCQ